MDAPASFIRPAIEGGGDIPLAEFYDLPAGRGTPVGIGTSWRFLDRHRTTRGKGPHATGQDRPIILKRREEWFDGKPDLDPARFVFIGEIRASTSAARRHGRCRRGERLREGAPHGHWKTASLVIAARLTGAGDAETRVGPARGRG